MAGVTNLLRNNSDGVIISFTPQDVNAQINIRNWPIESGSTPAAGTILTESGSALLSESGTALLQG
jgi:hypothetical protein